MGGVDDVINNIHPQQFISGLGFQAPQLGNLWYSHTFGSVIAVWGCRLQHSVCYTHMSGGEEREEDCKN